MPVSTSRDSQFERLCLTAEIGAFEQIKPSFGNKRQSGLDDDLREDRFHFDLGGT
jgi:hypothetical protein